MARTLFYTPGARNDIAEIRRWLTQTGAGPVARRKLRAIDAAVNGLRKHPCRFTFGPHPGVRERSCAGGYRVLYRVLPDTGCDNTAGDVVVLKVFGPGQDRSVI